MDTVLVEQSGPVLTLTPNRPEKLNAFTPDMRNTLIAAFDRADADDAVRAVIVTGAGCGFCAGAASDHGIRDSGGMLALRIFACLKPMIAASAAHAMEAHRLESRMLLERGRSPDMREGVTAFLEKRPAYFADMPDLPWTDPGFDEESTR